MAKGVADVAAVAAAASKMAPTAKLANMWQLPLITCTVREGGTGSGTDGRHLAKKNVNVAFQPLKKRETAGVGNPGKQVELKCLN